MKVKLEPLMLHIEVTSAELVKLRNGLNGAVHLLQSHQISGLLQVEDLYKAINTIVTGEG